MFPKCPLCQTFAATSGFKRLAPPLAPLFDDGFAGIARPECLGGSQLPTP